MNIIEEFLEDYERQESDKDMHYSIYYIPGYDQPEEAES